MTSKPYGCALVSDTGGLYPYVAVSLAAAFDTVYYYVPSMIEAFPVSRRALWGTGLPGVTRVNDFWDCVPDADLIMFPDLGQADLQVYLRNEGFRCWGAAASEILEQDRAGLKRLMLAKGMPRPKTYLITGISALEDHLRDPANENQYCKLGTWRGDLESFAHKTWFTTEPWFNNLRHQLGPIGEHLEFVVESKIDGIEIGYDSISVDGHFPAAPLWGLESKDIGYVGKIVPYDELPIQLKETNEDLSSVLTELQCRSMFSTEVRVDKQGQRFLIDATLRTPSPPGGGALEAYGNWPDVFYHGAMGEFIEPIPTTAYVAELILRSEFVKNDFLALQFPEEFRHLLKIHGHAIIDGVDYAISLGIDSFAEAVGLGDTMEEAMDQAIEVAESVQGFQVDHEQGAFTELKETLGKAQAQGIPW